MPFDHRPGQFSLFRNDKKGNDKAPDYKGVGKDLQGNDIDVAAWEKKGSKGTFFSCRYEPMRERKAPAPEAAPPRPSADDDIPF